MSDAGADTWTGRGVGVGRDIGTPVGGPAVDSALVARLRAEVTDRLDARLQADEAAGLPRMSPADQRQFGRQLVAEALEAEARAAVAAGRPALDLAAEDAVAQAVADALFGLGRLQRLLADPEIENINAQGADQVFVRYADGTRARVDPIADSDQELIDLLRLAAARMGLGERRFDLGSPRLSLQLPDGSRLFAVMAVTGRPSLSVRRHRYLKLSLDDLVELGTLDLALREFLGAAVRGYQNLIVCGGTASGKTTLLRALAAEIPPSERLITIEDSLELDLGRYRELHPDLVALEARHAEALEAVRQTITQAAGARAGGSSTVSDAAISPAHPCADQPRWTCRRALQRRHPRSPPARAGGLPWVSGLRGDRGGLRPPEQRTEVLHVRQHSGAPRRELLVHLDRSQDHGRIHGQAVCTHSNRLQRKR